MADIGIFASIITQLNKLGFYGFVLPWLLMFALVYGLLKRSNVFGEKGDKVAAVVAMALAFFVTAYTSIGDYFITLSGLGGMLLGALLIVVLFFALLGFQPDNLGGVFTGWTTVAFLGLVGVIVFFVLGGGQLSGISVDNETTAAIFMIIVVAIAVLFVTKGDGGGSAQRAAQGKQE